MSFDLRVSARLLLIAGVSFTSACGGASTPARTAADLSPASLYPLGAGYAWSYDVDSGDGQNVLAVARVVRTQGEIAEVVTGDTAPMRYALKADGITHADNGGYLLKAPVAVDATWTSGPQTQARVTALHVQLAVPAGTFGDCVTVQEESAQSGQRIKTTYCPGVGPAEVVSEMDVRGQTLRVTARLRGYTVEAEAAASTEPTSTPAPAPTTQP